MLITIFLAVIALALIGVIVVLLKIFFRVKQTINLLETDVHFLSIEIIRFLNTSQEFIRTDLSDITLETSQLIRNLNDKSHSFDFLFKPFHFLNDKLNSEPSSKESESQEKPFPAILNWIGNGVSLIKKTKELLKKYEKRT